MIWQVASAAAVIVAAITSFQLTKRQKRHYRIKVTGESSAASKIAEELNQANLEARQPSFGTGRIETVTVYDKAHDLTYIVHKSGSPLAPIVVLPPMFSVFPKCIQRLIDAIQRDVYVLLQHGMYEQPRLELRNEYLAMDDIEALIDIVGKPLYLVGYSAGAMRCCNYVCGTRNNFIIRVFALFTPFDPLQPLFFDKQTQQKLGAPIKQFVLKNAAELVSQGFATQNELLRLCQDCSMSAYDELWARKYGINLESYYEHIQPKFRLASAQTEIIFFSSADDKITGKLVPSKDELASCTLVRSNTGDHLGCETNNSDLASQFVARMINCI